ncbi:MAG: tetratricopeptide repeat protein [Bacteroidales bacterium]
MVIDGEWVLVDIDTSKIIAQEKEFNRVVAFCEKGQFREAKPILQNLIKQNPTHSDSYRIMGQILSDEGNQDEAVDYLIDALRWDAKNGWALLMMGNIFAKFKDDVPTAMKYYDQALVVNPNDNITMNNIGANLMQQGKLDEATKYFIEALKINDQYPNTHYALGLIAEMQNDLHSAFFSAIKALKICDIKNSLFKNALSLVVSISNRITSQDDEAKRIYRKFRHQLEFEGGVEIEIIESKEIKTAARFQFAENYNREKHRVLFNPEYKCIPHLIMHELMHYRYVLDARKSNANHIFFSNSEHKNLFIASIKASIDKLKKKGLSDEIIADFVNGMFDGINTQIFNAPIDLFIEADLHEQFSELRPFQFLSLYRFVNEGLDSVTNSNIVELSPKEVLMANKVLNIVTAMQLKELYGLDLINEFKATKSEIELAKELYTEFQEYKIDRKAGEEYELIRHWAQDLKLDKYSTVELESKFRKKTDFDSLLTNIENDPFGVEEPDPAKEREMNQFLESQKEIGLNMAVVVYMIDAMRFFKDKTKESVKQIAMEIAMQGTQGYNPEGKQYQLKTIPDKIFSGYQILAYYYVSWAIAIPDMLSQLQLPFDEEYQLALTINQK